MRIGIEAQRIFRSHKHGMDIVALELIRALQINDTTNEYFIFVKKGPDTGCLQETANFKIVEVPGVTYADWEQIFLPIYATKYKLDVLHSTSNTAPILYRGNKVLTLHDVIFFEKNVKAATTFSWYQQLGRVYRKFIVPASIRNTNTLITVSEFERGRISELLQMNTQQIEVIYNAIGAHFGVKPTTAAIQIVKLTYKLPENYIFYIGNTDPKKNIFKTIRAYRNYCISAVDPLPLVIADVAPAFLDKVLETTDCKSLRKRIVLTDYINNKDLPAIYAGASLFLYPSLRESFGIPVIEAMACGTPVITSNTSALPEVTGNAAELVDPNNEKSIGKAILKVLEQPEIAQNLVKNGFERIKYFSWNTSALKLQNIYQTI
jgi:glycosyltransferase involved in cell wall biosynthesis